MSGKEERTGKGERRAGRKGGRKVDKRMERISMARKEMISSNNQKCNNFERDEGRLETRTEKLASCSNEGGLKID